jgi:hypothetical protein
LLFFILVILGAAGIKSRVGGCDINVKWWLWNMHGYKKARRKALASRRRFFLFPYSNDLAHLPYLLIFPKLGNLVVLHRVACLRQPRKLLLSPRAIGLSLSLGPGKHIAVQAPLFRALNCGVGAQSRERQHTFSCCVTYTLKLKVICSETFHFLTSPTQE